MLKTLAAPVLALIMAAGLAAPASASLMLGNTLRVEYLFSDIGSVYAGPSDIVGGGASVTFNVGSNITTTLGDTTIEVDEDCGVGCSYSPAAFNGLHIFDFYGTVGAFTSVSILTNDYPAFNASRITFDADNIYLNFQGVEFAVSPSVLTLAVNGGGAVPEPASWALMIAGFGLAGAALRQRRNLLAA